MKNLSKKPPKNPNHAPPPLQFIDSPIQARGIVDIGTLAADTCRRRPACPLVVDGQAPDGGGRIRTGGLLHASRRHSVGRRVRHPMPSVPDCGAGTQNLHEASAGRKIFGKPPAAGGFRDSSQKPVPLPLLQRINHVGTAGNDSSSPWLSSAVRLK